MSLRRSVRSEAPCLQRQQQQQFLLLLLLLLPHALRLLRNHVYKHTRDDQYAIWHWVLACLAFFRYITLLQSTDEALLALTCLPGQQMIGLECGDVWHGREHVRTVNNRSLDAVALIDASVTSFFVQYELQQQQQQQHFTYTSTIGRHVWRSQGRTNLHCMC